MCEAKPGPRCASDTRSQAADAADAYRTAYPDGPPVTPLAVQQDAPAAGARYRAKGFTDDVTTCGLCGRDELKGTVRLAIIEEGGIETGEVFAGVSCAARANGTTADAIRKEAKASDTARADTHHAWWLAHGRATYAASETILARMGVKRSYATMLLVRQDPEYLAAVDAWVASHPEPERPHGC